MTTDFGLEVAARPQLSAAVLEAPDQVVGTPYTARFTLSDGGNVAQTVPLGASNSLNERQTVSPTLARLEPGASVTVQVRVNVPAEFSGARTQYLQLHADGDLSRTSATAITRVLPARLPLSDTFVTLPLSFSLGAVSGQGPLGLNGAGLSWRLLGETTLPGGDRLALDLNPDAPVVGYCPGAPGLLLGRQVYGLTPQPAGHGLRLNYGHDRPWTLEGSAALSGAQQALGLGAGWRPWPSTWLAADLGDPNLSAGLRLDRQVRAGVDAWQVAAAGTWTAQPWAAGLTWP